MENNHELIKKEFMLYKIREVEIEDMKLQIEELKLSDALNPICLEERVSSSKNCPNNDSNFFKIESLEKKIHLYSIKNKRVENALRVLNKFEQEVVQLLLIEKKSKTQVKKMLDRTSRQINRYLNSALDKIIF